jgi:hypothetical protein
MLFLGPLIVTLVFGVPYSEVAYRFTVPDMLIRVATSALVGSFVALGAIGIRIGTLRHTPDAPQPTPRRTDDEFIR